MRMPGAAFVVTPFRHTGTWITSTSTRSNMVCVSRLLGYDAYMHANKLDSISSCKLTYMHTYIHIYINMYIYTHIFGSLTLTMYIHTYIFSYKNTNFRTCYAYMVPTDLLPCILESTHTYKQIYIYTYFYTYRLTYVKSNIRTYILVIFTCNNHSYMFGVPSLPPTHINAMAHVTGNEPDHWSLYKKAFRPAPFTFDQYMTEFTRHADAVAAAWPSNLPFIIGSGVWPRTSPFVM